MLKPLLFMAILISLALSGFAQKKPDSDTTQKKDSSLQNGWKVSGDSLSIPNNSGVISWNDLAELNELLLDNPKITPRAHDLIMGWLEARYKKNCDVFLESIKHSRDIFQKAQKK